MKLKEILPNEKPKVIVTDIERLQNIINNIKEDIEKQNEHMRTNKLFLDSLETKLKELENEKTTV